MPFREGCRLFGSSVVGNAIGDPQQRFATEMAVAVRQRRGALRSFFANDPPIGLLGSLELVEHERRDPLVLEETNHCSEDDSASNVSFLARRLSMLEHFRSKTGQLGKQLEGLGSLRWEEATEV